MPDAIRATGGSLGAHPRRGGFLAVVVATALLPAVPAARAALARFLRRSILPSLASPASISPMSPGLALTLGILLFAVVTAVMLVRTRSRASQSEIAAREEIIALKADVDRAHALAAGRAAGDRCLGRGRRQAGDLRRHHAWSRRFPHRIACWPSAPGWSPRRRAPWSGWWRRCVTRAQASPPRSPPCQDGRWKPKAAPSAAAPFCGCAMSAACGAISTELAIAACQSSWVKWIHCARWWRRCPRRSGRATRRACSVSSITPMPGR